MNSEAPESVTLSSPDLTTLFGNITFKNTHFSLKMLQSKTSNYIRLYLKLQRINTKAV